MAAVLGGVGLTMAAAAQAPDAPPAAPDFARDVVPIVESQCLRCHNTAKAEGGLLLETYEDIMRGGDTGPPIVPGAPDRSPLVLQVEGRAKPKMPPKKDLAADEIAVLRAWVAAGAPYSEPRRPHPDGRLPAIAAAAVAPRVTSLAWRPDGRELAIAGYKELRRVALPARAGVPAWPGLSDLVRSVAWSADGALVAAGGGPPGFFGEVAIFEAATGEVTARLEGHRDYVYHVAFNPDGTRLASCGYDRQIRIWDTRTGRTISVLREHTEAVYAVAFDADGTLLASASADGSVKIWDVETGARLYTITDPTAGVLTLAFRPGTRELAAGGQDRRIRTWIVEREAARLVHSIAAHEGAVLRVAYSPDGAVLASSGADRRVRLWEAAKGVALRALPAQSDWPLGLAFSPDGRQLAVGRQDGSVSVYETGTGAHAFDLIVPGAAQAAGVAQR